MGVGDGSTTTLRPEFSAKRNGKRRQTEDTLKPPESENDRLLVVDNKKQRLLSVFSCLLRFDIFSHIPLPIICSLPVWSVCIPLIL